MRAPTILRIVWIAAGLALALGLGRDAFFALLPRPRELPRLDGATGRPWLHGDFALAAPGLAPGLRPPHIPQASSGAHGDEWKGRSETAWFRVVRRTWVHVAVAGYPQHRGCRLWAEFRTADGAIERIHCPLPDPREQWNVWPIRRPAGAVAVRIVAEDWAADTAGWLAFSHPFRAAPAIITAAYQCTQIFATLALALTLLWGPGLAWSPRGQSPERRIMFLLGLGPLVLAALGVLVWSLSGTIRPVVPASAGVAALWLAVGMGARRRGWDLGISGALWRTMAVSALVAVAVAAKSSYSVGPEGELFHGAVSRNLTVSDRLDSRYPYHVVQAAYHHHGPASAATEAFFYPWTFFSRGPLAGLLTTPIVIATGGQPPADPPDQRWSPFDPSGFAAYRLTMIALSSGIVIAVFALLLAFVGEDWAVIGAGLLALSPFGVHEVMFTWPKWAATTWVVMSFILAHGRRPLSAGFALAIGFFFHPMALLWAPWLAIWAAVRAGMTDLPSEHSRAAHGEQGARSREQEQAEMSGAGSRFRSLRLGALAGLRFGGAVAAAVVPWMAIGAWMPHQTDTPFAGQAGFIGYFFVADRMPATWESWWQTRWMNFANTFVPWHVLVSGYDHFRFGSAYGPSGPLVKFAQVWWNTLPFGLGLGLWFVVMLAMARAVVVLRAATWLFGVGPALLVVAYWGWDPLGLMRECGHPLLVALLAIVVVLAARSSDWLPRLLRHGAGPWIQLPETWLMLWLTTLANHERFAVEWPQLDGFYFALSTGALVGSAWVLGRHRANKAWLDIGAGPSTPAAKAEMSDGSPPTGHRDST